MFDVDVQCPYCSQAQQIEIERDVNGRFVQDCEVCCHPWDVHVSWSVDGQPVVTVERAQ